MYECDDERKFNEFKMKLEKSIQQQSESPTEDELPLIYIKESRNIDLHANYGTPYYAEIDISLVNSTNTSSARKIIYSNYSRVMNSIEYILKNECRPISILRDGDTYYIENGKHRYLAHILLGKKNIPVSIQERVKEEEVDSNFIQYKRNLYEDDGYRISYPEKIIDFYENNKEIFECINRVEMKCIVENKKYQLVLRKNNQDTIEVSNGVSAGNMYRSSIVSMELIKNCGFDIDEEFICTHKEFILEDKYDANNLKFDEKMDLSSDTITNIKNNFNTFEQYQMGDSKIDKLHSLLSRYKLFNTHGAYMELFYTGRMMLNNEIYYIISSIDKNDSHKIYTYVFSQEDDSESNLETKYLGKTEYKNIMNNPFMNRSLNKY